ncbi:hypothetical protein HanRHA438_Chr05g0214281 [Helianthus annuus]|nr:hypothetical protein HanRHA438_Chr05g0214281 [Helianthus annuus]
MKHLNRPMLAPVRKNCSKLTHTISMIIKLCTNIIQKVIHCKNQLPILYMIEYKFVSVVEQRLRYVAMEYQPPHTTTIAIYKTTTISGLIRFQFC